MAAIFISHSNRDHKLADEMKDWLEQEGYEQVFLAGVLRVAVS